MALLNPCNVMQGFLFIGSEKFRKYYQYYKRPFMFHPQPLSQQLLCYRKLSQYTNRMSSKFIHTHITYNYAKFLNNVYLLIFSLFSVAYVMYVLHNSV